MKQNNENSISPAELILADNSWRSPRFRTRTILTEEFGKKIVRKLATNEEANTFLKDVAMREKANAKYLKEHFDVLCGKLESNCLEYEYMPYQSLHQRIALELREDRFDKADELLTLYVQKIDALNKVHTCPKKFLSMVTQDTVEDQKFEVDCLRRGLLDLTPRNILLGERRWIVVDNEWSFDFPVPLVFILFRAIEEMAFTLQHEIRRCTSRTRPAVGILGLGLRTYYFPQAWVEHLSDNRISLPQLLRWEMGFRQYVAGSGAETVGHIKMKPRTKAYFPIGRLSSNTGIVECASYFLKKLPGMRRLVYFFERTLLYLQKQRR